MKISDETLKSEFQTLTQGERKRANQLLKSAKHGSLRVNLSKIALFLFVELEHLLFIALLCVTGLTQHPWLIKLGWNSNTFFTFSLLIFLVVTSLLLFELVISLKDLKIIEKLQSQESSGRALKNELSSMNIRQLTSLKFLIATGLTSILISVLAKLSLPIGLDFSSLAFNLMYCVFAYSLIFSCYILSKSLRYELFDFPKAFMTCLEEEWGNNLNQRMSS